PGAAYVRSGNEVVLIKDVTLNKTLELNNSAPITLTSEEGGVYTIRRAADFTNWMVLIQKSEEFVLTSGTEGGLVLDGMQVADSDSIILLHNASLRMRENVTITNNTVKGYGAGVVHVNSNFTMENGRISENSASDYGGAVRGIYSVFTMTGGSIDNNTAVRGAGVEVSGDNSRFIMTGGEITNNTAFSSSSATFGGGVYVWAGHNEVIMSGGKISYNSAGTTGGGVFVWGVGSKFTLIEGEITNNSATYGGGVGMDNVPPMIILGGNISNNRASESGGGVLGIVNMSGGHITNNSAKIGGGVYMNTIGVSIISGGLISGNLASDRGNGFAHYGYPGSNYFKVEKDAQILDDVYLATGKIMTISNSFSEECGVWSITPETKTLGTIIAGAATSELAQAAVSHLRLNPALELNLTVSGTNIVIGEPPVVHTFTIETLSPHDIAKGDNITIFGIAEGTDTLRYYVLAPYYSRTGNILVSPDGSYAANFSTSLLLADRPCFVVIQHPMYDEIFNVAPIQNELTGSNIFVYQNNTSAPTGGPGDTFLFNMTNTTGIFAFEKICQGIDDPANDDKELNLTFTIIDPRHDTQIALIPGWNYISVPKILNATESTAGKLFANVTSAVSPIRYDSDSKTWVSVGEGEVILPLNAYWINAEDAVLIQPAYNLVQTPAPVKTVYQGWNAIGLFANANTTANNALDCLNSTWKTLIPWNLADGNYDSVIINGGSGPNSADRFMTLGNGYWLYVDSGGNLTGQSI
ncbi:MAG: hypothetical protein RBR05_07365, partial [Candidatus Methanomethylophilaceae archaeon]|nr:hypothetical protein [Candidatus Methanomethylophilaceae archaeon]